MAKRSSEQLSRICNNEHKLACQIVSFQMSQDNEAVLYKIVLKSYLTDLEWEVERRYSDFHDYYSILTTSFFNIPSLPRKTITKVTQLPDIEARKEQLNSFINIVSKRSDVISNMASYHFFKLDKHFPDFKIFQPLVMFSHEELEMEATSIDYINEGSLVFVGMSKMSNHVNKLISKVNAI